MSSTPSSAASWAALGRPGASDSGPVSTTKPSMRSVRSLPPSRSLTSTSVTRGRSSRWLRRYAAVSPAMPPPRTIDVGAGRRPWRRSPGLRGAGASAGVGEEELRGPVDVRRDLVVGHPGEHVAVAVDDRRARSARSPRRAPSRSRSLWCVGTSTSSLPCSRRNGRSARVHLVHRARRAREVGQVGHEAADEQLLARLARAGREVRRRPPGPPRMVAMSDTAYQSAQARRSRSASSAASEARRPPAETPNDDEGQRSQARLGCRRAASGSRRRRRATGPGSAPRRRAGSRRTPRRCRAAPAARATATTSATAVPGPARREPTRQPPPWV